MKKLLLPIAILLSSCATQPYNDTQPSPVSLTNQGKLYLKQGEANQAIGLFNQAASQGEPQAEYMLGLMYTTATGVEQNKELAKKWLSSAAAQGDPEAKVLLKALPNIGRICGRILGFLSLADMRPVKECFYQNYSTDGLRIAQVTPTGFLVHGWDSPYGTSLKTVYIFKTDDLGEDIVDGSILPQGNYKYIGPYTYPSMTGSRTVYSFMPDNSKW